jgi:hypothetical protein
MIYDFKQVLNGDRWKDFLKNLAGMVLKSPKMSTAAHKYLIWSENDPIYVTLLALNGEPCSNIGAVGAPQTL